MSNRRGFSLGEILLAIGAFVVAILAVVALAVSMTRLNQESIDRSVANQLALRVTDRTLHEIYNNDTPVTWNAFWTTDYTPASPLASGSETVGNTVYTFDIWGTNLVDQTTGAPLGDPANETRLKKVTTRVNWFGDPSGLPGVSGKGKVSFTGKEFKLKYEPSYLGSLVNILPATPLDKVYFGRIEM